MSGQADIRVNPETFAVTVDGKHATIEELEVRWFTSGLVQKFRDLPANHSYRLVEGGEIERLF